MFENWKKNLDKGGGCGVLFVDLSKALDCLQHGLLLAKLNAYEFGYNPPKLISSFLSNRKYRTKINSFFSEWEHLLIGVPQGSLVGPLLFNIYNDLFLFMAECNVAYYADDTTLRACEKELSDVQRKLESESLILFEWFRGDSYLKANSGKSHIMLTTDNKLKINVKAV